MSGGAEQTLRNGLRNLSLDLDDGQVAQLLAYLAMIGKWTKVYNLTAVRDPSEMMTHHLLAAMELTLINLAGLHQRVEQVTGPYDVICSRAFASLGDFTSWSAKALAPGGVWMAMKGKHPSSEIDALNKGAKGVEVFHVEQLTVPGLSAERRIVWARPASASII